MKNKKHIAEIAVLSVFVLTAGVSSSYAATVDWNGSKQQSVGERLLNGFLGRATSGQDSSQQPFLGAFGDMSVSAVDEKGLLPLRPDPCLSPGHGLPGPCLIPGHGFPGHIPPGRVPPGATFLGMTTITNGADFDAIRMNEPGIRFVMMKVHSAPVEIFYLSVQFGNGTVQELHVREVFAPGSTSRHIDLNGDKRRIVKIQVFGRAIGGGIPVLEFIGFR